VQEGWTPPETAICVKSVCCGRLGDIVVSLDGVWTILCGLVFDEFVLQRFEGRSDAKKIVILDVWVSSGRFSGRDDDSNVAQC
jgi:hypothetical protein